VKDKILLDTYAVLAYLQGEKGSEVVKDILASKNTVLMNEINIGETYYILTKSQNLEKAEFFLNTILPSLNIKPLGNTLNDVIEAARIKARYPISYADAFVVATALREKAIIVTGDPDFRHLEQTVKIRWI